MSEGLERQLQQLVNVHLWQFVALCRFRSHRAPCCTLLWAAWLGLCALLSIYWPILLCLLILGDLHFRFGFWHDWVASRVKLLQRWREDIIVRHLGHFYIWMNICHIRTRSFPWPCDLTRQNSYWKDYANRLLALTFVFAWISLTLTAGSWVRLCLLCAFILLFIQIMASFTCLSTFNISNSSKCSYCSSWVSRQA